MIRSILPILLLLLSFGCQPASESTFQFGNEDSVQPFTGSHFDNDEDKFSFAIFTDLTGGERPDIFKVAVEQLNLLRPELIMNVGDLIEGSTQNRDSLMKEWSYFDERVGKLRAPVFYTGGNHDLTGTVLREVWEERYGASYYHFVYKNALFLVLDTEDLNPEMTEKIIRLRTEAMKVLEQNPDEFFQTEYFLLPEREYGGIGPEQSAYIQQAIAEHPDVRWTFLFMHKPVYKQEGKVDPDYLAIEEALEGRNYTVFNGHIHVYSHIKRNGMDHITLSTTGGYQNPEEVNAFDQLTWVTLDDKKPSIVNFKMEGVLDKTGHIPLNGDSLCYSAADPEC